MQHVPAVLARHWPVCGCPCDFSRDTGRVKSGAHVTKLVSKDFVKGS